MSECLDSVSDKSSIRFQCAAEDWRRFNVLYGNRIVAVLFVIDEDKSSEVIESLKSAIDGHGAMR